MSKHPLFNIFEQASRNHLAVSFPYVTKKGDLRVRVGYVEDLRPDRVTIKDVIASSDPGKEAFRTCKLDQILSDVQILGIRETRFNR